MPEIVYSPPHSPPPGTRCLRFADVAPGRAYHAALSMAEGSRARGFRVREHAHNFYELVYVIAGEAIHGFNGAASRIRTGDLIFLQPGDWHFLKYQTGRMLHYINIAVEARFWESLQTTLEIAIDFERSEGISPAHVPFPDFAQPALTAAFRRALEQFQEATVAPNALRAEACSLLAVVMPHLARSLPFDSAAQTALPANAPPWLTAACRKLRSDPEALRLGLPVFVAESGVTRTHLARVLKALTQQTPTEYINALRLAQAARLLTTSTLSILDIAGECGFEQPAYFYRLFRERYQTSPHAYRVAATRHVAP